MATVYYFKVSNHKDYDYQSRIFNNEYDCFMNSIYFDFSDHELITPDNKKVIFITYLKANIDDKDFNKIFSGSDPIPMIGVKN